MGNTSSPLSVDYAALNRSCEQIRNIHSHFSTIDHIDRQVIMTTKTHQNVLSDDSHFDWDTERRSTAEGEEEEESHHQLRTARSLPNVHDESDSALCCDLASGSTRERCNTISQPIRIPESCKSSLTVENVALQQQQQHKRVHNKPLDSNQLPLTDSPRRIELVKCDDIVIHLDSIHSPAPTASSSGATTRSSHAVPVSQDAGTDKHQLLVPVNKSLRIGSAPADFMGDFIPRRGEKIPLSTRCRYYSTGINDNIGSPSLITGIEAASQVTPECSPFQRPRRGQTLISFLENFSSGESELERENAHFSICQAVICALEQLKWRNQLKKYHKEQSQSQASTSISTSYFSSDLEDEVDSADVSHDFDPELMSISDVAPSGVAEWSRASNSAEACALSLLSRFRRLPKASDIHWEGFVEGCGSTSSSCSTWPKGSFCRGTNDWAPPRPQIIFTRKGVTHSRKKTLQDQNYRCRGCGIQVSREYSSTFRLCGYTGQFYCTACHRNQVSIIPARVLDDWDFKLYPVSVVAYRLLEEIWFSPLFDLSDIDPSLFDRVPVLNRVRHLRYLLRLAKEHVMACRFYLRDAQNIFQDMPEYLTTDLELWAMADLKAVKRGSLQDIIQLAIGGCDQHVKQCELCLARGYFCEICHKGDILYPWDMRVSQCQACGACTHIRCWIEKQECRRCLRIRNRK